MTITWRHWLLLQRLADDTAQTGSLCDLYDLEAEGFVFKEGDRWFATSEGRRALQERLGAPN